MQITPASNPTAITKDNVVTVMENVYLQYNPIEQVRWQESNTDMRVRAGDPGFLTSLINYETAQRLTPYVLNITNQPCDMVTGYQRQHRRSINCSPVENSDSKTSDQFSSLLKVVNNNGNILENFSRGCDLAVSTGLTMLQPYLDFNSDPINGDLKLKVWEYNSFMCDSFFRDPTACDCSFVWFQEYMARSDAIIEFPDYAETITTLPDASGYEGRFYFLPENYYLNRSDLLVVSYFWFKTIKKKKKLFNRKTKEIQDFADDIALMEDFVAVYDEMEIVEVNVPHWKLATVVNRQCVYFGDNPYGDIEIPPFIPIYWNYDPQLAEPSIRNRSLVRALRDMQFLFNRKVLTLNQMSEASINSGWLYLEDMIANEEVLMQGGNGYNIKVKGDQGVVDPRQVISKIQGVGVPATDIELANQLLNLRETLTGISPELLGMATDDQAGITHFLKQGAGLVTLQKYFDQWDLSLKLLGKLEILYIQYNWQPFKVARILGELPTEQFFHKAFSKYDCVVSPGLNTPTQKNEQLMQIDFLQKNFGLAFPAEFILDASNLVGKDKLEKILSAQQQQQTQMQQLQQKLFVEKEMADLKNKEADTQEKNAMAAERKGRTKSNVGLYEERVSEVTQNMAKALKEKVGALKELLDTMDTYSDLEEKQALKKLGALNLGQQINQEQIKNQDTQIVNGPINQT